VSFSSDFHCESLSKGNVDDLIRRCSFDPGI